MNFFKGSGRCGLAISPKYTNNATKQKPEILESAVFNEESIRKTELSVAQNNYPYGKLYQGSD
jgi:hypothetical protein